CGRRNRALQLLQQAVGAGLDTFDVHLEMGNLRLAEGELDAALSEYKRCIRSRPDNPIASFNCGLTLRKMGKTRSAEEYYAKALELDPVFSVAALELANLWDAGGRSADAAELLRPLVSRDPSAREARLTLAKIYIRLSQPENALQLLSA